MPPIKNVIIAEHAAVNGSSLGTPYFGIHSVINALALVVLAAGDAGFEIDDTRIRLHAAKLAKRRPPDVAGTNAARDHAICGLGKLHVVHCRLYVAFVQDGVARMRQHLINATPGHNIAAQEQPYG